MNEELKPCPFCGSNAIIKTKESVHTAVWLAIKCLECGAKITSSNFNYLDLTFALAAPRENDSLDERWNRRANND